MKLRKAIVAALMSVTATAVYAQPSNRSTYDVVGRWDNYERSQYFSVRLGMNVSQLFFYGMEATQNSQVGFSFGLYSGWQLGRQVPLYLETGFEYNGKGANMYTPIYTPVDGGYANLGRPEVSMRQHYLTLPVVFKYKIKTGVHGLSIQPLFGAFLGFGVGGNSKYYFNDAQAIAVGLSPTVDRYFPRYKQSTFTNGNLRAFDAGLRIGCGIAYTNFYFQLHYDVGLYNIATNAFDINKPNTVFGYNDFDDTIHTGCFTMTAGIEF